MENIYFRSLTIFYLGLTLILGCLYFVERKKYIFLWCISWLSFAISFEILYRQSITGNYFLGIFENLFFVLAFGAVVKGSVEFFNKKPEKMISIATVVFCVLNTIYYLTANTFYIYIPRMVFGGALLIYAGILSIKTSYVKSITKHILGSFFILWGVSTLLLSLTYIYHMYPAFSINVSYISSTILQIAPVAVAVSLQTAYFQHNQERQAGMNNKIQHLTMYDTLTGIYNRGYCEIEMENIDVEDQLPISIITGDMNGLKLINDTFGHKRGDQLLVKVAEFMKISAPGHIVGRWGGDEFIIVLVKTNLNQAMEVINNIKKRCDDYTDHKIPFDVSLGAATKSDTRQSMADTIKAADAMLYMNKLAESRSTKKQIVDYLINTLLEKNIETKGHITRMENMASIIVQDMGLSQKEQQDLFMAIRLHDIGKISIPDEMQSKAENLTPTEMQIIRRHPEIGYRIALASEEYAHIANVILSHHERWDGKGYPMGLSGNEIPLMARIISVVDAFDTMTHSRVYRNSMSNDEALTEIENCAGTHFDPEISKIFVNLISDNQQI